ncbi:MAG: hypothetical protein QOH06_3615 [Acidobacteriota bacterium]|jgi:hypothetical protein|nr:hypothetical protein [Acidobacteriota bacterium]
MHRTRRLLFLFAVVTLFLYPAVGIATDTAPPQSNDQIAQWMLGTDPSQSQACGYDVIPIDGGLCVSSWCGGGCAALDCVWNGGEFHWIDGCGT